MNDEQIDPDVQEALDEIAAGDTTIVYSVDELWDTLGSCGCTDYHTADCPIRTG